MKVQFQKRHVVAIISTLVLVLMTTSALGAQKSGQIIDAIIPKCKSIMERMEETFSEDSYTVSEDFMLGKGGSVFIDMDKGEVKIIGENSYLKYTFEKNDGIAFSFCTGMVLFVIDYYSVLDYGANVYYIANNDTLLLEEKEISTLAAQFMTAFGL